MASRTTFFSPLVILVLLLCLAAAFIVWLKVTLLHMPLQPDQSGEVWTVEARIDFTGRNGPASVSMLLPAEHPEFVRLDEDFISRGFGLTLGRAGDYRQATWTRRRSPGEQALFYRALVYPEPGEGARVTPSERVLAYPDIPDYPEPMASAISDVLNRARDESADTFSFASRLLAILSDTDDENVKVIRQSRPASQWPSLVTEILAGARIRSRLVSGISLREGYIDQPLITWVEVNNDEVWRGFNPQTGEMRYPERFYPWVRGDTPLLSSEGARSLRISFSTSLNTINQVELARDLENRLGSGLMNFTLYSLPIATQEVFKVLLMVPLGAIVISVMRVMVGIPTFGTFTPVLIALAFRETQLGWGIMLFILILFMGFLVRIALANLRLLLVPRLSAMLIIVIGLMVILSLLTERLGFTQGFSIALFPMVILTMTIERMSIVWEERGGEETLKETIGTLIVSTCGFYVMTNALLMHLMFNFPELLMIVLAVSLLLGTYTGYRLSEVVRFRDLLQEPKR